MSTAPAREDRRKIFVVGFQKTGTSSLEYALGLLGINVVTVHQQINDSLRMGTSPADDCIREIVDAAVSESDGIADSPSPFMFEHLDRSWPGAKFILSYRDPETWLRSYQKYFPDENSPLRAWMYGVDRLSGNEARYIEIYTRKINEIRTYFSERPGDFLEVDLAQGDGWYELVTFLGKSRLGQFPRRNIARDARAPKKNSATTSGSGKTA